MLVRSGHGRFRRPGRILPDEAIERQLNERRAQLVPFHRGRCASALGVDASVPRSDGAHVSPVSDSFAPDVRSPVSKQGASAQARACCVLHAASVHFLSSDVP